jgi:assimilatory nitrate reductase catalytic subunit
MLSPKGFYEEAIQRVAAEISRIQATHGNDAFAVLAGASMTSEKCYLMGKFARVCLKTRHIDYNGGSIPTTRRSSGFR